MFTKRKIMILLAFLCAILFVITSTVSLTFGNEINDKSDNTDVQETENINNLSPTEITIESNETLLMTPAPPPIVVPANITATAVQPVESVDEVSLSGYDLSSPAPVSYNSYDEYINVFKKYEEEIQTYLSPAPVPEAEAATAPSPAPAMAESSANMVAATGTGDSAPSYGDTNNQVSGVNEGDVIKNDGEYIYILSNNVVSIVKAYPADKMSVTARIVLASGDNNSSNIDIKDIYVSGNNLVILYSKYSSNYNYNYNYSVGIDVYDIKDRANPKFKRAFELDGSLTNSREQNGIFYLFTIKSNYYSWIYDDTISDMDRYIPLYYDSLLETKQYVNADRLYTILPEEANYYNFSTISIAAIDLNSEIPAEVSAYTGDSNQMYMSGSNIYMMQNTWANGRYYTEIIKFGADKTNIKYIASKKVPGYMHNQFSADEYGGNLRIATTEWGNGNHLFILGEKLNLISYIMKMAVGEHIKSVRFMGEMAYIVTFETVDPLFVLDLSKPEAPKITGELKIPGYSTYLHPIGDGLLLGVGEDTATLYFKEDDGMEIEHGFIQTGFKASIFDVSDPYDPKEISKLRLGGINSYSDISNNHKSFLNIPQYSMFSIRGRFTNPQNTNRSAFDFTSQEQAMLVSYDKEEGLKLVKTFEGNMKGRYDYVTANRMTYIGSVIYHFDGVSLNAYDIKNNYNKLNSITYAEDYSPQTVPYQD